MSFTNDTIFNLLPSVYQIRDKEGSGALKALIDIIADQAKLAEKDIAQLYDNWFIETCEEWVVPYIGDLLGIRSFHKIGGSSVVSQRAYVANTLSYRRRKGIAPVLEQLCLDVTGWRAHAVEFFQLLAATQYMNHVRLSRTVTPDLRRMNQLDLLNSPFDTLAHTVDIRHIESARGRYNISNIGLFIWRLQSYPVSFSDARIHACPLGAPPTGINYFTFDPVGNNTHLFNQPVTETSITHISQEVNVPGLLRRRSLFDELDARRQAITDGTGIPYIYFDDRLEDEDDPATKKHPVFEIYRGNDDQPVPPEEILISDLSGCCIPPSHITVAVDPVLGRFVFTDQAITKARVSYNYGFSGDIGAGTYNRHVSVQDFLEKTITWQQGVSQRFSAIGSETIHTTFGAAIAEWNQQPAGTTGIITVMDSCSYIENIDIIIPEKSQLLIVAAQWPVGTNPVTFAKERIVGNIVPNELRPHLNGNISVWGNLPETDQKKNGSLVIDGLLIEGKMSIKKGNLGALTVSHCTLVPASGGIEAKTTASDETSNQWLTIQIKNCICGPVNLYGTKAVSLLVEDSILDQPAGQALKAANTPVQLTRSTFLGSVYVKTINADNCIFNGKLEAVRRQTGCIRFSYIPEKNPKTPHRFRCQSELEISTQIAEIEKNSGTMVQSKKNVLVNTIYKWLAPGFSSLDYGHHAYGQLSLTCPEQIKTGADDGSEMGAFCSLQQPQRSANMRIALDEYLSLGLEAGIIYVT